MKTKVSKWGNSIGVRLPKHITDQLKVEIDNEVEIYIENDAIVIRKKTDLDKMLSQVSSENIHTETEIRTITGKEIW